MNKEIEIPEGYKARIEGNKVIIELKESENERITAEIVDFISRNAECGDDIVKSTEWLAYLEKQKEQKPESCDCSRDEESYTNGIHHVLMNPEAYGLIKQQPAEQLGGTFTSYDIAKTFTEGQNYVIAHPEKFGLCKSVEWSEDYRGEDLRTRFAFYTYKDEDDALYLSNVFVEETSRNKGFGTKILAAAEKVAETIGAINIRLKVKQNSPANAWYRKHGYGYMAFEGDYDWLEKTLEYLKPIKSEWSEEDEALIENVCTALKGYALHERKVDLDEHAHRLEEMSERLKSLRPQPKEDLNAIAQREYARGKQDGYWEGVKAERESCKTFHYESPNWPPKMSDLPTETTTNEGVSSIQPHWKPSEE